MAPKSYSLTNEYKNAWYHKNARQKKQPLTAVADALDTVKKRLVKLKASETDMIYFDALTSAWKSLFEISQMEEIVKETPTIAAEKLEKMRNVVKSFHAAREEVKN